MPIHRLTIHELLSVGSHITNERLVSMAQHVQRELCIRLARRLLDIQTLPFLVVENPHIQKVHMLYRKAFEELIAFPKVVNINQDREFVRILKHLVQEGVQVVPLLARGTYEASLKVSAKRLNCDKFLGDMVMSRISRRVIAEQFIALHHPRAGYVGIVCTHLSLLKVIQRVSPEAARTCEGRYGVAPEVQVRFQGDEVDLECSYIPTHLEYIIFELLKNAMRAVCEKHVMSCGVLPAIEMLVTRGPQDMSIRISDQGGGVEKRFLHNVFDFGFSTVNATLSPTDAGHDSTSSTPTTDAACKIDPNVLETSPMAGPPRANQPPPPPPMPPPLPLTRNRSLLHPALSHTPAPSPPPLSAGAWVVDVHVWDRGLGFRV
jgi:signal transduction histidine kinase